MVNNGYFTTGNYSGRYLTFNWWIISQDIVNNYTKIGWNLVGSGGSSTWYQSGNFKVVIDGVQVYFSSNRIQLYNGTVVASGTKDLYHDSEGNRSFGAWAEAGIFTVAVNVSGSGSWQLPQIHRNSKIENTQQTFNIEDGITLNIKKYNAAFTDNLTVKYGNTTLIEQQNVNSTVNINFTTEQLDQIYGMMLTTNKGKFTFTLTSYKDNTPIGNANVFEIDGIITQANPIFVDFGYENIDTKTLNVCNNSSYFIKDNNELKVNITTPAVGQKGATIVSYMVVCDKGNATIDTTQSSITGPNLKNLSTPIIKVYATDTRGNTTEVVKTITNWIAYNSPTKVSYNYNRISGNEMETNFTFSGEWYPTLFNTTVNELSATYKFKETKDSQYTNGISNIVLTKNGSNYEFNGLLNGDIDGGFSVDKSFNVVITVSDLISSVDITYLVLNGSPAMDLFGNCVSLGGPYNENQGGRIQGIYEVGDIFISTNSRNPSIRFGGVWELFSKGRVLVGVDPDEIRFSSPERQGGEMTHTLTIDELPSHNHKYDRSRLFYGDPSGNNAIAYNNNIGEAISVGTEFVGGGQAHNNMQPFVTCYIWKRIS